MGIGSRMEKAGTGGEGGDTEPEELDSGLSDNYRTMIGVEGIPEQGLWDQVTPSPLRWKPRSLGMWEAYR